ncbi:hypothetical protein [Nocardia arizonensis]|uniref:hypothetical protein n=1 Tax=Nocardia arizonensis TaxID=1141647 RepID=UPI0006D07DE6|nr:hypothetical protein [Nocardia arizonensis]
MSDRSAIGATAALAQFRRHIGCRVVFVPPVPGRVEHGVIARVDDRMVYVDYGYPNPVWPQLGNAIATHPSNLRIESIVAPDYSSNRSATPIFSDAPSR